MPERIRFDNDGLAVRDYATEAKQRAGKTKYLTVPIVTGEIILIIAVLVALFMVYQLKYTGIVAAREQDNALLQLKSTWQNEETTTGEILPGDVAAIIRTAKFSDNRDYPVFAGTDMDTLAKGPGIYPGTQDFGDKGNTSIAAHRDGWNAPFYDIDALHVCDVIEVETRNALYTYRVPSSELDPARRKSENEQCFNPQQVRALSEGNYESLTGTTIVSPDKTEVTWPVPTVERDSSKASLSLLTLTSCHPHWSNEQRYIVHAVNTEIKRKV